MTQFTGTPPLERTFRNLVRSRRPNASEVIAYAVLNSTGDARRIAISAALDRQERSCLEAIIRVFHEIPPDLQSAAVVRSDAFLQTLRQNVRTSDRQVRANTCEFLIRMDDPRVAYLLADLLQDVAEDIKKKAQDGLLALAHGYHTLAADAKKGTVKITKQALDTKRYALLDALLTALRFYKSHERAEMIAALLSLDRRGDEVLMDILNNPMDRRRKIILDILETAHHPRAIAFILTMLKNAKTAVMAVEMFETRFDMEFVKALMSDESFLSNTRITNALTQVKFVPWLRPGTEKASQLPPLLAVRAVRFLLYTGAQATETRSILERLTSSKNVALAAAARFALEAQMRQVHHDRIDAGLVKIEERCPPLETMPAEPPADELVGAKNAVASESKVSALLSDEALFRNFVNSFDSLGRSEREAAWSDFEAKGVFEHELRRLLSETEADTVLRAIKIVEWKDCQEQMSKELALLTKHPDGRVRSSAVRQLGKSGAYEALKALFETLNDSDRRVLANAVEALEGTGHKQVIRLLDPLMKHPDNRVRANAAKAAWSLGSEVGRQVLVDMLKSPKPGMRLSALWGLRQIGASEEMPLIREIAKKDPDEQVKKSAEITLAELENVV